MTAYFSPVGNDQFIDANGNPLNGGKIYTYLAASSIPATTWTTIDGNVAQTNPIIINSLGATANPIWLTAGAAYKFVIKDSTDVTMLYTFDNITGINDPTTVASITSEWESSLVTPAYVAPTVIAMTGDFTLTIPAGIRIRTINTGGTVYSTVTSSVYNIAGYTVITVLNDSGAIDSGVSFLFYSKLSPVNSSLPNSQATRNAMGIPPSAKNLVKNANFVINQDFRPYAVGTVLAANEYWFDCWKAGPLGCTIYIDASAKIVSVLAGTLVQDIEMVTNSVQFGSYTFSWGTGNLPVTINQGLNVSSGSVSPIIINNIDDLAKVTITLGIGNFSRPQLEYGRFATGFEYKPTSQDLLECMRYYEPSIRLHYRQNCGASVSISLSVPYKVRKSSATPTITQNAAGSSANIATNTITATESEVTFDIAATAINLDTYILGRTYKVISRT